MGLKQSRNAADLLFPLQHNTAAPSVINHCSGHTAINEAIIHALVGLEDGGEGGVSAAGATKSVHLQKNK